MENDKKQYIYIGNRYIFKKIIKLIIKYKLNIYAI